MDDHRCPTGLFVNSGSGLYVRRNTFRNMARDYNFDNSNPPAGTYFEGNIVEADASVFGAFSTLNKVLVKSLLARERAMLVQ